jgi:hypothetical protein
VATEQHISKSFVARIWLEHGSNGETVWRGHIHHVQGGQETYFRDLATMNEFLARVSGVPGFALTAQPSKDATRKD